MSLRFRIYLLILLAVAPAFALLVLDHRANVHTQEVQAEQRALHSTLMVAAELDQVFKGFEILLRGAGETSALRSFEEPECSGYLARLTKMNANAGGIAAADGTGQIRCGEIKIAIGDREYFQRALVTDELVVGTYTIGRVTGEPVLPLALRFSTGEGWGVMLAGVRVNWLREHFANRFAQLPPDASLTIVDRNHIMMVRLPNRDREGLPLPKQFQWVVTAPAPGTFRAEAQQNADRIARFVGFVPLGSAPPGIAISMGYPQEAALAGVRASAMQNYVLLGAVAALAFLAAVFGGRAFIRRPMAELLVTIGRWRNRDLSARVQHASGRSEFDELGRAFNSLADELESALQHKDMLLRELSHRVMNSLNTISALFRLQSRSAQPPDAGQFAQAISRIDAVALAYRRMQAAQGVEAVEFASFLAELCQDLHKSLMSGRARCVVKAEQVQLSPDQAIPLSLIVNELLTNAIKHGSKGDEPIIVRLETSPGRCRLAVKNYGVLPAGYQATETKGFGMKMISSMVKQLEGDLEVSSADGMTEFVVSFPTAAPQPMLYGSNERVQREGTPLMGALHPGRGLAGESDRSSLGHDRPL